MKSNEDKKNFYFEMLGKAESCICRCEEFGSKHIMGQDRTECLVEMRTKRHDWVLAEILNKMEQATIEATEGSFFYSPYNWKFLLRFWSKNVSYDWPRDLLFMRGEKKPHVLMYLLEEKRVMIVEIRVSWERWLDLQEYEQRYKDKLEEYEGTVDKLKKNGYEVKFKLIELGCRGVFCQELDKLFREEFKMERDESLDALKAISKKLISFPYKEYKLNICLKKH